MSTPHLVPCILANLNHPTILNYPTNQLNKSFATLDISEYFHQKTYPRLLIAALFTLPSSCKNLNVINSRLNKLWYIHETEYYSVIKKRICCWYTQQHSWISQIQSWIKEARHKSMHFLILLVWSSSTGIIGWEKSVLTSRVWYWLRGGIREVQGFWRCSISSPWVVIIWVYTDVKIHWALCAPKSFLNFILMVEVYFSYLKV